MQWRREVREREEVVELPQLRGRVYGLLATGRPGIGGLVDLGRGSIGFLRAERRGAGDNVEQPPHVRNGEVLCVVLCARRQFAGALVTAVGGGGRFFYTLALANFGISGTYLRRW
jgi:hypothetical protein